MKQLKSIYNATGRQTITYLETKHEYSSYTLDFPFRNLSFSSWNKKSNYIEISTQGKENDPNVQLWLLHYITLAKTVLQ